MLWATLYTWKPTLKTSGIILWVNTVFQPTVDSIGGLLLYGWKIVCIWETSNRVRSNLYPSYLDSFVSKITISNLVPKMDSTKSKIMISPIFWVECDYLRIDFHEFRICWEIDAKAIPSSIRLHTILMRDGVNCVGHSIVHRRVSLTVSMPRIYIP